ncbi:HlyD family secretion protein [Frigoriglobus tundricola]|uniref:Membrane fusion component of MSF-type tripartite multidrug efflux system n=1 Tax=Frigoriglobus tundricola TaxID=2774151 RepID=A0A6M5YYK4_9BACT|nr:HlyD family secretion protein [Frigoriglobus tundricola]QJW99099.1 Membrane fusion component of MSF-type tripartite multidrug efflux system [Frigoriglobus tundricola]
MSTSPGSPHEQAAGPNVPAADASRAPAGAAPVRFFPGKRPVLGVAALAVLVGGGVFGAPKVQTALDTVSTDDAYVNGHVTFVAPRVSGQVSKVLVDDNYRVKAGDVIVELDPEPYQVQVHIKRAALGAAEADRNATESDVRGTLAQLRSQRWKLQTAMEQVDNQVALLKARAAALRSKEATLARAKADLARAKEAYEKGASGKQDYDAAIEAAGVADALVKQAAQEVAEVRVSLGQPPVPENGDLTSVPADLNQTFSTVRQTLADLIRITAQVGLPLSKAEATPKEVLDEFRSRDAHKDVDRIFDKLVPVAPAMIQADAKVLQAKRDLELAELNLRYCKVLAEIDGVVTRRNVNPGNNVQAGQQLMAVRSLTEIWIDANFKETQLAELRIGQRVEVFADTYGSRRAFRGRITGFTSGTGSTLALLPAQNATGNFVKVVQRLPVRIELDNYDPDSETLFTGLSVTPYVYFKEPATGPNAGRRLQELTRTGVPTGAKQ